jgi:hypothetical protein
MAKISWPDRLAFKKSRLPLGCLFEADDLKSNRPCFDITSGEYEIKNTQHAFTVV